MSVASATVVELLDLFYADWIKCAELLELLAHLEGVKRVVRLVADPARRDALFSFLSRAALQYRVSEFGLRTEFSTSLGDTFQRITPLRDPHGDCVLFVGSPDATAKANAMELGGADALSCAEAYEYPACCAASYVSLQEGTPWCCPFCGNRACGFLRVADEQARVSVPSTPDNHPRFLPLLHSLLLGVWTCVAVRAAAH